MSNLNDFNREAKAALWVALQWLLLAVPTGLVCGVVGTAFHLSVEYVTELRAAQSWLLLCLPLSNFYHRIVTPCEAVCTLCGQHRVVVTASESRQPHDMQPSGDVHISAACHIYYEACACGETDSYVLACGEKIPQGNAP